MRNFIRYLVFPIGFVLLTLQVLILLGRLPDDFWSLDWTAKKAAFKLIWPAATPATPATMTTTPAAATTTTAATSTTTDTTTT